MSQSSSALRAVAGSPVFVGLSPQEIAEFAHYIEYRRFVPGASIFLENMEGEYMYLILQGTIKVSRMLAEGREKLLVVLGAEDVFGEMALFDSARREATARVMEEAQLAIFSRERYAELCQNSPRLALKLTQNIVRNFNRRIRTVNDDYRTMLQWAAETG